MSLDLRSRVAVVGVGCTPFGELYDKSPEDLLCDAVDEALAEDRKSTRLNSSH